VANFEYSVELIIDQEIRRCHLLKYKLISSKEDILSLLFNNCEVKNEWNRKKSFSEFKNWLLHTLYSQYINLKDSPFFENWLYEIYKNCLYLLLTDYGIANTIDEGLKPFPYTAAFRDSHLLLSEIFTFDKEKYKDHLTSEYIEESIYSVCIKYYPVQIGRLIKQLNLKDIDFWTVIWHIIRGIAKKTVEYSIKTRNSYLLSDKALDLQDWIGKISEETHRILSQKISNDELAGIADGENFRKYIRTIAINALKNEYKKNHRLVNQTEFPNDDLLDISFNTNNDSDNADSLKKILIDIIYNERPDIYKKLVEGINKEGLAMIKYISNGYSYEEYIEDRYSISIDNDQYIKEYQRLRKILERTRQTLKNKLKSFYLT